ncbi:hypothetical protein SCHPADRAFT_890874 [Schizopora paradoxa]|uniref:Thioesterase domain-containing protein n=1 Tax=Schizopora paradoxa TaxID=27342 RepID=A0A0H2RKY0_9AGAM|nr:hypothetical protein SCHPADRAFT_890874 [Schizopora paradoxa]
MCGRAFGDGILSRLEIVEANAWKDRDEARVVCELDVEEDMTDANGNVPGSCFAFLTSLFSGLPHIVLDLSKGGTGAKGAAQVLSTTIHRNAHVGDRLKIYGRTMSRDFAVTFGRCEIWSSRDGKLVASASQMKAEGVKKGKTGNKSKL